MKNLTAILLALLWSNEALAQAAVLQGGSFTQGRPPIYGITGSSSQPVVIDGGPAGGNTTGQGISELNITARGTGTAPYAGQGTGPNGEVMCVQDAVSTNATGFHYLCMSANAGGGGLISYGAGGTASALPLTMKINGTSYQFPFSSGYVVGPGSSTVGHIATWANTAGTLLADGGVALTIGGTANQIQYNAAGSLGGFTMSGDCTVVVATGVLTCTKVNGQTVSLGGTLTTAAAFTQAGAFATTLTSTGATNVTLPTTGTLATLAGSEALTNKTYNGLTLNATTGTFALTNGKTLTVSNSLGYAGTDGSTLNIGTGGTLGTAAYTAASAYVPSNTGVTNSLGADVVLNNTGNYFDGPSVAQGSTGTWFCSGQVTLLDTAGAANFSAKMWDGTSVIDSGYSSAYTTNAGTTIHLSGYLATPAANIRISAKDTTSTSGLMRFNSSGNSKDSTLSCFRIN